MQEATNELGQAVLQLRDTLSRGRFVLKEYEDVYLQQLLLARRKLTVAYLRTKVNGKVTLMPEVKEQLLIDFDRRVPQ
ncbi:MAG: hypothetical protein ACYCX4_00425 [Bacillota bacterium]